MALSFTSYLSSRLQRSFSLFRRHDWTAAETSLLTSHRSRKRTANATSYQVNREDPRHDYSTKSKATHHNHRHPHHHPQNINHSPRTNLPHPHPHPHPHPPPHYSPPPLPSIPPLHSPPHAQQADGTRHIQPPVPGAVGERVSRCQLRCWGRGGQGAGLI